MLSEMQKALESYSGEWRENNGINEYSVLVAERKTFLSSKKLTYSIKMRIDDSTKVVKFTEMLKEVSSGLDMGVGFKTESYNTLNGPREETIEEQSTQFGKSYSYTFDFKEIRSKIEEVVKKNGYEFKYQITVIGL